MTIREISVIVCTRNRAHLLSKVIEQLRSQDYPADAFEIVVVDNGSNDNTAQVTQDFVKVSGVPVRYIYEGRTGITYARNRGAEDAHYPYLAYLDDDCSVEKTWLSMLVQGFDLHKDVVAVGGRNILDWSQAKRPTWLGLGLETWLSANTRLGLEPRLLDEKHQIIECNMAIKWKAWKAAGGFLGMEQFGSQHMSAGEVLYLLYKLREQGGKVAFSPQAVAFHQMRVYTVRKFLQRGYSQGVSDGILDYLIHRRSWPSTMGQLILNSAALIILTGGACFHFLLIKQAKGMHYLVRSSRRLGLVITQLRLDGNWPRVQMWVADNHPSI